MEQNKVIITVVGKDTVGIIARICTYLADGGVNVLDITQTIVQGYFNMMMIVDINSSNREFAQLQNELEELGNEIGVQVKAQKEEIFEKMHRL
ncbi:MAG: ACT domain-containing protein [Pseudobutyrivibrio sp.]|nr:ACT domain-containing protein [Pseudobutyrivibrio sp.]